MIIFCNKIIERVPRVYCSMIYLYQSYRPNKDGVTPLITAAWNDHEDCVKLLIQFDACWSNKVLVGLKRNGTELCKLSLRNKIFT